MRRLRRLVMPFVFAGCGGAQPAEPASPTGEPQLPPITIVDAPPPVRVAPREPEPPKQDPAISRLTVDSETLAEDAKDILRNHPPELRVAAAERLVALVREVDSRASETETWRDARVGLVFDAMAELGGAALADVLLDEAERASASLPRRRAALLAAETALPGDAARLERRKAIAVALLGLAAKEAPTPNGKEEAILITRRLTPGFRRCYDRAQEAKPDLDVSFELSLEVDARGAVSSARAAATPAKDLARCVEAIGRAIVFPPIAGGKTTVVVPIAFTPNRIRSL
jgi:hypothetical protein